MNAYDFLLSLDRLDGRLIDETMDCLYPKERRSGKRVVRTLLIAAVLASLFTAAAFASDFLGFREAIIKPESIGRIPDFTVTHEDGSSETRDMSNSAGVSMTKPENAPESMQPWVENINAAAKEWDEYRREERNRYLNEMLPNVGRFYDGSSTEEPEYVNNGDGTYTVKPVKQRIYKDPVTAPVIEYEDESSFFVISEEEYENINEFLMICYGGYYQSKYDWNYGAWDEASDAKLSEISEKHGLRLRSGETELYWDERPIANGAPADRCFSPEELVRMLTERCCKGNFFKTVPTAFDKLYFLSTGSFGLCCELPVEDGAELCVYIRNTVSDEFATGNEIGAIVTDYTKYLTRTRTAPDGTELYIAQGDEDAYIYAYLDSSFMVMNVYVNPFGNNPNLKLTEDYVNQAADSFNYKNL